MGLCTLGRAKRLCVNSRPMLPLIGTTRAKTSAVLHLPNLAGGLTALSQKCKTWRVPHRKTGGSGEAVQMVLAFLLYQNN